MVGEHPTGRRAGLPGVTIVIDTYDHAAYAAEAVESALAQDHDRIEVIVVDDGSGDGTPEILRRYADRVRLVLLAQNGGQVRAINAAWPLATHEILIFLDGDDRLLPHAASTVARAWRPELTKLQFCLESIDEEGRPLGHVAPKYPDALTTETIRAELLRTGSYPCAQACGNAYARWFLDKLAPIGGLAWFDMILEVNAPLCGEVATLPEALACYRIHGRNDSRQTETDPSRFAAYAGVFEKKIAYLATQCRRFGFPFDPQKAMNEAVWYLELELTARKLDRDGGRTYAESLSLGRKAIMALMRAPATGRQKLWRGAWLAAVSVAPAPLAAHLIRMRYVVPSRPRWIERLVGGRAQESRRPEA